MTEAQTEPAHDVASLRVAAESPATDPGIREAAQRVLQDAAAAHERAQRVAERIARLRARTAPAAATAHMPWPAPWLCEALVATGKHPPPG
jgi:hypothetical protein